jgi:hypothetical protein
MHPRALAANAAGSAQRTPWKAGPRGLEDSDGQRARLDPQRPPKRIQLGERSLIVT